ncbi:hypothetical protein QAD02_020409 [Eretmocerus hayati]|uniref:Uncharacterized protein n=1 Tax=Eretmocerus hayati TaxID=131215 RepID=A0ACC2PNL4_9HYME|nr:hypothetical protein QAD02_020409 [Eretmocerus hayati]
MADEETENLLKKLGLEALIRIFKENNINQATIQMLDRDMIIELIKDMGSRAVFLDYWGKNISGAVNNSNDKKRKRLDSTQGNPSKPIEVTKQYTFKSIDEILNEDVEGRRILAYFAAHKKILDKHRNKMCQLLLEEAEAKKIEVDYDLAAFLALSIKNRFDGEVASTYHKVPVKKKDSASNESEAACGKLISIRNNRKNAETEFKKMLEEEEKKNAPLPQNPDNDKNLAAVFAEWDLYQHPSGFQLINIDFKAGKYTKVILDYDLWMGFISLVRQYSEQNGSDNTLYEYLEILDSTNENIEPDLIRKYQHSNSTYSSSHQKVAVSLMALSHMASPQLTKKFSAKEAWKASTESAKETMIVNPQKAADVSTIRREVREQAAKRKESVQPYIIIVAKLNAISDVFVNVDDTFQHLWLMIQRGLYRIETSHDNILPTMSDIMSKLPQPGVYDDENDLSIEKLDGNDGAGSETPDSETESDQSEDSADENGKKESQTKTNKRKRIIRTGDSESEVES